MEINEELRIITPQIQVKKQKKRTKKKQNNVLTLKVHPQVWENFWQLKAL